MGITVRNKLGKYRWREGSGKSAALVVVHDVGDSG